MSHGTRPEDCRTRHVVRHILDIFRCRTTPLYKSRAEASSRGAPPYPHPATRIVPKTQGEVARIAASVPRRVPRGPPTADPEQHPSPYHTRTIAVNPCCDRSPILTHSSRPPHSTPLLSLVHEVRHAPHTSPPSPRLLPSPPPTPPLQKKIGGGGVGWWSRRETPPSSCWRDGGGGLRRGFALP